MAASSRQTLLLSTSDPRQWHRLVSLVELGHHRKPIEVCPADSVDHMPCEDPRRNSQLSREMNLSRERHCPLPDEMPLCLIPPPPGYKIPVQWPESLHKIWHSNIPHNKIADRKGHQGWMKEQGPHFIFPGGGTMFPDGAAPYIEKLGQYIPINGGTLRTALIWDVARFGGSLLSEGILTLSFAPRDSHKAQIQFALERGIPAFVLMLGTRRLPFPAFVFDLVHCSRCLIPFTTYRYSAFAYATYFVEVDRLLRPGGYLVVSGPPVQWPKQDKEWADLQSVARALCYELISVDGNTVIWKKPDGDSCLPNQNEFVLESCDQSNDPSTLSLDAWLQHLLRWTRRVAYYNNTLNLKLGTPAVRNVMDMKAFFGGFAAALASDPVWVKNVVPARKPLTLGVIHDRGFIGVYQDWCNLVDLMVEIDRMSRPQGTVVIRDSPEVIDKVARIARAVRWTPTIHDKEPKSHGREKILVATKTFWKLTSTFH
ncbi:putative methyltransferase PMT13 [Hibiscus syriacus]|uniref:Methyltransferase n=1 Tax=Hibiscus syriacus TaxID=106335 RepID=A0A6A3C0Y5_HIBSY|nr:putative methyltransferase PMT13 [Hibiscus syriacus]